MKIIGTFLETGKTLTWNSVEEASEATVHSVSRVQRCILTGGKWKGWVFDEAME